MVGEHLGALVVADVEDPLGDLAQGRAVDRGQLLRPGLYDDALRVAGHPEAGGGEGGGEGSGSGQGRVVGAGEAVGLDAAVDHQRGDRADDVVGDVVAAPGRVVARAGEEAVVEADRDATPAAQRVRGGEGQRRDVGAGRIGGVRLRDGQRLAGEQRVTATDEHDLAGPLAADDAGAEGVLGPHRRQGGTDGQQLGRRGGEVAAVAGGPGLGAGRQGGHGADDVAAQVGVGEVGRHGRQHPVRGDRGRGVGGRRGRRGRRPVGQVEARRRQHGLRLGHRVGGQPGEVARPPLVAVGADAGRQEGERRGAREATSRRGGVPHVVDVSTLSLRASGSLCATLPPRQRVGLAPDAAECSETARRRAGEGGGRRARVRRAGGDPQG